MRTPQSARNHQVFISSLLGVSVSLSALGGCALFNWDPPRSSKTAVRTPARTPASTATAPSASGASSGVLASLTHRASIDNSFAAPAAPPASAGTIAAASPSGGLMPLDADGDHRPGLALNTATGLPITRAAPKLEEGTNVTQVSFAAQGGDFDPDISRDGTRIVFSSTQHSTNPDIYIKTVDSRVVTRLTSDSARNVMPKLSPDGQRIAFCGDRAGNWDIYVMPASGGKAIQVTNTGSHELHPSWSPDGQSLVYCRLGEVSGQWELWTSSVNTGGAANFIGYGMFPEWCPTPRTGEGGADKILFQKSRDRGDRAFSLWTVDYKDGQANNATEVASSPVAACINPTWSPDGQWIAFATVPLSGAWAATPEGRPTSAELWMADLNGTSRVRLTSGPALALMPAWGPNGRIYFVSNRGSIDNLWSLDAGSAVRLASAWKQHGNTEMATAPDEGGKDTGH
jgi:TolB protein